MIIACAKAVMEDIEGKKARYMGCDTSENIQ